MLDEDVTAMYDEAYKKQPGNEELGAQTFMANAKISNWKVAQQVNDTLCTTCLSCLLLHLKSIVSLQRELSIEILILYCPGARSPPKCTKPSRTIDTCIGASWRPYCK